jgi:hypothetical protein
VDAPRLDELRRHEERERQRWLGKLDLISRQVDDWTGYRKTAIEQGYRLGCTVDELSDASGLGVKQVRSALGDLLELQLARERRESRSAA